MMLLASLCILLALLPASVNGNGNEPNPFLPLRFAALDADIERTINHYDSEGVFVSSDTYTGHVSNNVAVYAFNYTVSLTNTVSQAKRGLMMSAHGPPGQMVVKTIQLSEDSTCSTATTTNSFSPYCDSLTGWRREGQMLTKECSDGKYITFRMTDSVNDPLPVEKIVYAGHNSEILEHTIYHFISYRPTQMSPPCSPHL
eukprot:TRINITY_DN90_c0_g2_i2.p1 TRINITY_DN90_c0_g2~~TRINITY_DN90_c0_g2_i2.p1  ORF type:complete len:223 (-),score=33.62 TRINITY_DN90_c0_g2_i2:166-765(-)